MSRKSDLRKVDLHKQQEPITFEVNIAMVVLMSILFGVVLALIGLATMHYPMNHMGWV